MTSIRVLCDTGCDVYLQVDDIALIRHSDQTWYVFKCPTCEYPNYEVATPHVVSVLETLGVEVLESDIPWTRREIHRLIKNLRKLTTAEDFLNG